MRRTLTGLTPQRLRRWLILFFLALAIPTAVLTAQAYSQLKWEAFHQQRLSAEELAERIRTATVAQIAEEEARGFGDYGFLVVSGSPQGGFVQRSPLSALTPSTALPGVIGYFQVDADGAFSTPLLPSPGTDATTYGIDATELAQRQALASEIHAVLGRNRLVRPVADEAEVAQIAARPRVDRRARDERSGSSSPPPAMAAREEAVVGASADRDDAVAISQESLSIAPDASLAETATAGQAMFDRLNRLASPAQSAKRKADVNSLGRVEDLRLEQRFEAGQVEDKAAQSADAPAPAPRATRKELAATVGSARAPTASPLVAAEPTQAEARIHTFESEIDPFEFSRLESGHLVLFRKVWRDGRRYVQGLLIAQRPFIDGVIGGAFRATALSRMSDLAVAFQGEVLAAFGGSGGRGGYSSASELQGALLYQTRLNAPLGDLQLIFSVNRLPTGPGGTLLTWVALVLAVVLCGGFLALYRLGLGQLRLARQQQDFVSAVSHELKTPLTSIRMYGEMLREGWAPEERRQTYYEYIHDESERLSRLIDNVLQLARMTRNELRVELRPVAVGDLLDAVHARLASQVERAGFALRVECAAELAALRVEVDRDYVIQILINLIDNAIKFAARAERREIEVGCGLPHDQGLVLAVRDYGPGIADDQLKKIFRLFYRAEDELTRETVGTGIGLALVRQLAVAMHGSVDVVNAHPGAEFRVTLRLATDAGAADRQAGGQISAGGR